MLFRSELKVFTMLVSMQARVCEAAFEVSVVDLEWEGFADVEGVLFLFEGDILTLSILLLYEVYGFYDVV